MQAQYDRKVTDYIRPVRSIWMFWLALACLPQAHANYVLGGVMTGDAVYGWNGSGNAAFRTALGLPANFGPGGTVSTPISTVDFTPLGSLAGIDGIVVPWWSDSSATAAMVSQLTTFFQNGGDLLIAADDTAHDPINSALGIPTQPGGGGPWTATGQLLGGPFDPVGPVLTAGAVGWFSSTDLAAHNGTIGAYDGAANATSAYWAEGVYCPGCGALVLVGDVDVWAIQANFLTMNANARFSLNAVSYLVADQSSVPEPTFRLLLGLVLIVGAAAHFRLRNGIRPPNPGVSRTAC